MQVRVIVPAATLALAGCGFGEEPPTSTPVEQVRRLESTFPLADWPCGFGLQAGTGDQTVAIFLEPTDFVMPTSGTHDVPGDWTGTVALGRDLFANWCDDVIEPGEPEPVRGATYPVVAGTIELDVTGELGGQCVPATAVLTGLVVDVAGEQVSLGELEVANDALGCFAG